MIAPALHARSQYSQVTQDAFLAMLPLIRAQAQHAFRHEDPEAREELICEVLANAFVGFRRLVERGKDDVARATPLAKFAIKQVRTGRLVGGKLNIRDVTSRYAQVAKGIRVERLDRFDADDGQWQEILIEDRTATPADIAAARIDVAEWFKVLGRRKARIAKALAAGEPVGALAKRIALSPGRISQLRREFRQSWLQFQGELAVA